MAEPTKEQQQLIALANARLRLKQAEAAPVAEQVEAAQQAAPQPVQEQPAQPQQEPLTFGYNAGKAIEYLPAGVMDIVTRGEGQNLGRGFAYLRNALVSPSFQRTAPPLAAAVAFPPSAVGTTMSALTTGIAGWLGSRMAGDTNADAARNAIYSAYPGGTRAKEAASFFKAVAKEGAKETGALAAYATGAEIIGRSIEQGRPAGFTSVSDFINTVGPVAALGTATGALKGYGAQSTYYKRLINETRDDIAKFLGTDNVTLGAIDPERFAALENRVAQSNPQLKAKIERIGTDSTERYRALFGDVLHPTEIADKLNKYAGKLNEEKASLENLRRAEDDALRALEDAKAANLSPDAINKIEQSVLESKVAQINQQARVRFWSNIQQQEAGILKSLPEATKDFAEGVSTLFAARKEQANRAYAATGVNMTEKMLDANALADAAERALANRRTPDADALVKAIRDAGGESGMISINEMKELRANMMSAFFDADPRRLDAAEALASRAYDAVTKRAGVTVRERFGKEAYQKFRDVNKWYAETADAMNSKYVRQLLADEPGKNILETIAGDVASNKFESYQGFQRFVDAVAKQAPDVGKEGSALLYKGIRDGFLSRAARGGSTIDFGKLTKELNSAASRGFPVEQLGFGTKKQIADVNSAFKQYTKGTVTADELDEFYRNPLVRAEIARGGNLRALARKDAAASAFKAAVKEDTIRELAGARLKNNEVAVMQKERLAKAAGLSRVQQERYIQGLREDPLYKAFERDSVGMPKQFPAGIGAITNTFAKMAPNDVSEVVNAMRKSRPDIAADVSKRIAADAFGSLLEAADGGGYFINPDKVKRLINPAIPGDEQATARLLRSAMDPKEYARFKDALPAFERLSRYYKQNGTVPIGNDLKTALGITTAASLNRIGGAAGYAGLIGRMAQMADTGRYNLLSKLLIDDNFAKGYTNYVLGGQGFKRAADDALLQRFLIQVRADPELSAELQAEQP